MEVLVQKPAGSRPSKSQCFSLKAKQKYCPRSSNLARRERGSAVLFYSGLKLIEWGSLTLGRVICFIQSTDSNDNLIRNTLTDTKNNVWPNVPSPCGPVKLTHKINHRSCPEKSLRVVLDFSLYSISNQLANPKAFLPSKYDQNLTMFRHLYHYQSLFTVLSCLDDNCSSITIVLVSPFLS